MVGYPRWCPRDGRSSVLRKPRSAIAARRWSIVARMAVKLRRAPRGGSSARAGVCRRDLDAWGIACEVVKDPCVQASASTCSGSSGRAPRDLRGRPKARAVEFNRRSPFGEPRISQQRVP